MTGDSLVLLNAPRDCEPPASVLCASREVPPGVTTSCTMFKRRQGTAGINGFVYETKLLSLLYFRAIHDKRIKEFQLASDVDDVGVFDDICFKATVEGFSKPALVFIQAKHREHKKLTIDLTTYFMSYLKIRQRFDPWKKDLFFDGKFDETKCLFVLYTTARSEFKNGSKVESNSVCSILNDLIGTGGTVQRPHFQEQDVKFLCEMAFKVQIMSLAEMIAKFILSEVDFRLMLKKNIMLRYHVILAQKVFEISEIQPNGNRIATFRHDFFDTNEEYLTLFRDTLVVEILKRTKKTTDIFNDIHSLFMMKQKFSNLEINKKYTKSVNRVSPQLNREYVYGFTSATTTAITAISSDLTVELATRVVLLSPEFKLRVPAAFGNKDITINKKRRIEYLTSKITDLLEKYKSSKMVTIDKSLGNGFLQLNGGLAGTIGNIFVLDDNTKLMKITDKGDALETNARSLYENLNKKVGSINENRANDKIPNLSEYKFCFKSNKLPKLLFEFSEYEENLARDFLNKLLLFVDQADVNGMEEILKSDIDVYKRDHPKNFQVKTVTMFLHYYYELQNWRVLPNTIPYLTRKCDLFQNAINNIIEDPLMNSINLTFMSKIKSINYTFTEDAVRSLNLQDQHSTTVIVAENSVLTVIKVMQHLKNNDHVVLDIEDIVSLPTQESINAICRELINTNEKKVLILLWNKIKKSGIEKEIFENVAEAVRNKKTIFITNDSSFQILQSYYYFARAVNNIVRDEKNSLIDMSEESQKSILESARVKFQGIEVGLEHLVRAAE